MITRKKSTNLSITKYLVVLPVLCILFVLNLYFNTRDTSVLAKDQKKATIKTSNQVYDSVDVVPSFNMEDFQKNFKYPEEARKACIEGKVMLRILVGKNGYPEKITVVSSDNKILNQSAINAFKKVKFVPAKLSNKPVKTWVTLPVSFKLK